MYIEVQFGSPVVTNQTDGNIIPNGTNISIVFGIPTLTVDGGGGGGSNFYSMYEEIF